MMAEASHRRTMINDGNITKISYQTHGIKAYSKKTVLRAMMMYHKKWFYEYRQQSELFQAQFHHGRQFLIDLFILSEVYMNHFPEIAMHKLRTDVLYVVNQIPDYRIRYENN